MKIDNIIIQAGGIGSRMGHLTANKPKGLIAIDNLPLIFHLFKHFPDSKFKIICDYKSDVFKKYLEVFADVDYELIDMSRSEKKGNGAGLDIAVESILVKKLVNKTPEESLMIIWSDLLVNSNFDDVESGNYICVTNKSKCSWRFDDIHEGLRKMKADTIEKGVVGCFIFDDIEFFREYTLPSEGSFTRWLVNNNIDKVCKSLNIDDRIEIIGTAEEYNKYYALTKNRCRPYNKIDFINNKAIKQGITQKGIDGVNNEIRWYSFMIEHGFNEYFPKIFSTEPLTMSIIPGDNAFRFVNEDKKKYVIKNIIHMIDEMHAIPIDTDLSEADLIAEYYTKTISRLNGIKHAIKFADKKYIKINGFQCYNILHNPSILDSLVKAYLMDAQFGVIHGDCTLSNIMVSSTSNDVYMIDPRGFFGSAAIAGDIRYDWAKLYYSIQTNFDQFNIKNFTLDISDNEDNPLVEFTIASNGWEKYTNYLISKSGCNRKEIELIVAIIWLSMASCAWEDYDSMCLAFYYGLYQLEMFRAKYEEKY